MKIGVFLVTPFIFLMASCGGLVKESTNNNEIGCNNPIIKSEALLLLKQNPPINLDTSKMDTLKIIDIRTISLDKSIKKCECESDVYFYSTFIQDRDKLHVFYNGQELEDKPGTFHVEMNWK